MNNQFCRCAIPIFLLLMLCGCSKSVESAEHSFFALDTYITMQATGPDAKSILEAVEEQIIAREEQWSVTAHGSEIYAVNHSNGEAVSASDKM